MLFMHVTGEHGCVAFSFASLPRTGVESKILSIVSAALKSFSGFPILALNSFRINSK